MAELGDKVKDRISGHCGIVTGISLSLYGCRQICLSATEAKDGKIPDAVWLDDERCEVIEREYVKPRPEAVAVYPGSCESLPRMV